MTTLVDEQDFRKKLSEIITKIKEYYPEFDSIQEEKLRKAFWFGYKKHESQKRYSGSHYFSHPIAAVELLFPIKPDLETVIACILHDVLDEASISPDEIEAEFGPKVRLLCEGVEKMSRIQLRESEKQYENLRRLFMVMADDIRVIFIRLVDRIHNLQTLRYIPKHKQKRIARESLEVYAPVAGKLGLYNYKSQIEDLAFQHLNPDEYEHISKEILDSKKEQRVIIQKAKNEINDVFNKENIQVVRLQGRPKNLFSIFTKMKRKNFTSVTEVFDLFAIRILVKETSDCYKVLGSLHSHWKPISNRFKDYIAVPKSNGYQSLHTTVLGFGKIPIEVQIKTVDMHLDAEYGPASHWAYKQAKSSNFDTNYVKRMDWFPEDISLEERESPEKFYDEITNNILQERIYVFTPKGEIINLPAKSTPVDFAFTIHSDIGESCVGAKVNGIIKPLDYMLKKGDVIEILTQKGRRINPSWLYFVKSSRAITKIRSFINKTNTSQTENLQYEKNNVIKRKQERKPILKKIGELFTSKKVKNPIIIGGERNIPYYIAACCTPEFGQDIVAYKNRGIKTSVHNVNCKELKKLDPQRILEAYFNLEKSFKIMAKDRVGLLHELVKIISDHGINIINSNIHFDREKQLTYCFFTIECSSKPESENVLEDLENYPEVILLTRE